MLDPDGGLDGRIAAVLDAGPCPVGLESTIVGWSGDRATLLRPGGRVLVELDAAGRCDRGSAQLTRDGRTGTAFPWARLDGGGLAEIAVPARLAVTEVWTERRRSFALLARAA